MLSEKESAPQPCHHCEDAPYTVVCPVNAITCISGAVQLNESLYVNCKLCSIACPLGAAEFSGSRPLNVPTSTNTPKASPVLPAPARVGTLLDWAPGVRATAVKYDLRSFDERGPTCVRICPIKILHLMDNTDIAHISRRKRELAFDMDFGDLTLFQ